MKGSVENVSQSHRFCTDKGVRGQKNTQFVPVSFESPEAETKSSLSDGLIKKTELIFPAGFCSAELLSQALAAYRKWHQIDDFGKTHTSVERCSSSHPLVMGIQNEVSSNISTVNMAKMTLQTLEAKIHSANIQYQTSRLKVRFYGLKRDTETEEVSAFCHDWEIHKDLSQVRNPWCVIDINAD